MKRMDWRLFVRTVLCGLSIVVLGVVGMIALPRAGLAQTCPCGGPNPRTGRCYACPLLGTGGGTGGGTIIPTDDGGGGGGTGCGTCAPDSTSATEPVETPELDRGDDWVINVQTLFPNQTLEPGAEMTVMLVRTFPATGSQLLQPLENDGQPALYTVRIGEDGNTEFDFGKIGDNAVGGTYKALAIPEIVDSPTAFWTALSSVPSDVLSVQAFGIDDIVSLDDVGALIYENGRRIDIPLTIAPDLASGMNLEFEWQKEGQPLPQAEFPLQPGIYDTILRSQNQSIVGVYAPWEFVVENFAPGLAPQLGPYFSPGEYEISVIVDGVLESTETFVVP